MARLIAVVWLALVALASPLAAQTFPQRGTSPVVDQANLLRPEQELDLSSKSENLFRQTGRQFVVATVASLEGRTIEDYGYRLGRQWKIGDEKRDDGVILLVAPKERKVRIETGYGARVFLTDAVSSVIVRESILPAFRRNDYAGGINAGADQIIRFMSLSPAEAQRRNAELGQREVARGRERGGGFGSVIFFMMILLFVVLPMMRRMGGGRKYGRRRRGFGAPPIILWGPGLGGGGGSGWGGGGGGFGGFGGGGGGGFMGGGGSFGGGGSSGGW